MSSVAVSGNTILVAQRFDPCESEVAALPADARVCLARWVPAAHLRMIEDVFVAIPHPAGPHVYLDAIATHPSARGRGEGSALANSWLRSVAREHVHLDSSDPRNLPFYRRLGFTAAAVVTLPHGAGEVTPMDLRPRL